MSASKLAERIKLSKGRLSQSDSDKDTSLQTEDTTRVQWARNKAQDTTKDKCQTFQLERLVSAIKRNVSQAGAEVELALGGKECLWNPH